MAKRRRKHNTRAWQALKRKMRKLADARVRVGVFAGAAGGRAHVDADGGSSGITLVELMAIHEYGSPANNIDPRRPIRRTFESTQVKAELARLQKKLVERAFKRGTFDRVTLGLLGEWGVSKIKRTIKSGPHLPPPLKAATVKRKKSSRPLVHTGQLANSITYEVVKR